MSNMLSAVSNQIFSAYNTVATNVVSLANQTSRFGGRVINSISPALSSLAEKVKGLNPPSFLENAWAFAKSNVGISTLLLSGAVTMLVLSRRTENQLHKYALLTAGVATLALSAIAVTQPFGNNAKLPLTTVKA